MTLGRLENFDAFSNPCCTGELDFYSAARYVFRFANSFGIPYSTTVWYICDVASYSITTFGRYKFSPKTKVPRGICFSNATERYWIFLNVGKYPWPTNGYKARTALTLSVIKIGLAE